MLSSLRQDPQKLDDRGALKLIEGIVGTGIGYTVNLGCETVQYSPILSDIAS